MRKTISEYGRIIIMVVVILIVGALIFSLAWANEVKKNVKDPTTIDVSGGSGRSAPTILVQDQATSINKELDVSTIYKAYDADGNDITDRVVVSGKPEYYNETTKIFKSSKAGFYELRFSVKDEGEINGKKYFLTTEEKINIMVDGSVGKYTITLIKKVNGTLTTNTMLASKDEIVALNISPNTGYHFNGAEITYTNEKNLADNAVVCPYCNSTINNEMTACEHCKGVLYRAQKIDASKSSLKMPDHDITITPIWAPNELVVSFEVSGGTFTDGDKTTLNVIYGEKYGKLPEVIRAGHSFIGWFDNNGTEITSESVVSMFSSHTLYARWNVNKYFITYDANGGYAPVNKQEIKYNNFIGTMPIPTRDGFGFVGWYLSTDDSVKVSSTNRYTYEHDITLKAIWTEKMYTIFFDGNGGLVDTEYKSGYRFGGEYGELPLPNRNGYVFDGWYDERVGGTLITNSSIYNVVYDQTLYAHWSAGSIVYVNSLSKATALSAAIGDDSFNATQRTSYISGNKCYMIYDKTNVLGQHGKYSSTDFKDNIVGLSIGVNCTSIADNAFKNCINLENNICIPSLITEIGSYAFYNTSLNNIVFDEIDSILNNIKSYAFSNISLDNEGTPVELVLPESLSTIGEGAFSDCKIFGGNLIIPENVSTIYAKAFMNCTSFDGLLKLSNNIVNICVSSFENCSGLTEININDLTNTVESKAFSGCTGVEKLYIPITISVSENAFSNCNPTYFFVRRGSGTTANYSSMNDAVNLPWKTCTRDYTLEIQNTISEIKNYVFTDSPCMDKLIIPITTSITNDTFTLSNNISNFVFTAGLNGANVLDTCSDFTTAVSQYFPWNKKSSTEPFKIEFSAGISTIGKYLLNASAVSEVIINDTVCKMSVYSIYNCTSLHNLTIPITIACSKGQFKGSTSLENVSFTSGITSSVYETTKGVSPSVDKTTADTQALFTAENRYPWITSTRNVCLNFLSECEEIGTCYAYGATHVKEVNINPEMKTIKNYAFDGANGITKMIIPNTTEWGISAFGQTTTGIVIHNLSVLKDITIIQGIGTIIDYTGTLSYSRTPWYIAKDNSGLVITIADGVTRIGDFTFADSQFSKITIPNSVESIGEKAFERNDKLTDITMSDSLMFIESNAFYGCSSLLRINDDDIFDGINKCILPVSIESIENNAFENCSKADIDLSGCESLTYIGDNAFTNSGITNLVLPFSITDVGKEAFSKCTKMLTANTTQIESDLGRKDSTNTTYNCDGLFSGCSKLERAYLQDMSAIPNNFFSSCKLLKEINPEVGRTVVLSSNIKEIGSKAFYNTGIVSTLEDPFIVPGATETIGELAFSYNDYMQNINIPASVNNISTNVFNRCATLEAITVNAGNQIYSSLNGVLFDKEQTILYKFPENHPSTKYVVPDRVTLAQYSFANSVRLESIIIGRDDHIENNVFEACEYLGSVYISSDVTFASIASASKAPFYMVGSGLQRIYLQDDASSFPSDWNKIDASGTVPYSSGISLDSFKTSNGFN